MENQEQPLVSEAIKTKEIIGLITLGKKDPRQMTKPEFDSSPELLYHGSAKNVEFLQDYDYGDSEMYNRDALGDGSTTLGIGFYTVRVRETAENYSRIRQNTISKGETQPFVVNILPHQAKILDLRTKDDLHENGSFPRDLAVAWQQRFQRYLDQRQPPTDNLAQILYEWESDYAGYIEKIIGNEEIDLRHFLQTDRFPSPPWSYVFSRFMVEQGIDGIVYNEGGEGKEAKSHASFVFYNLEKIGTWESWQTSDILKR
jgi:hypothetical protein